MPYRKKSQERVSEWYTIFTLAFQVILGFAVSRSWKNPYGRALRNLGKFHGDVFHTKGSFSKENPYFREIQVGET